MKLWAGAVCLLLILLITLGLSISRDSKADGFSDSFRIGVGTGDITGPASERGMLGYADLKQTPEGIHIALKSKAFVIEDSSSQKIFALVVVDLGMIFESVKSEVLVRLNRLFPGVYRSENLMISATHTHSGPGGYSHYDLFNVTTLGFDAENFEVIVNGIVHSVNQAHLSRKPGTVSFSEGDLHGVTVNRSLPAYTQNLDASDYPSTTDLSHNVLRFRSIEGSELGLLSWFAIHPVSMSKKNRLVSGDNSGYAALLFQEQMKQDYGQLGYVAAFASANEGDSSPNIFGQASVLSDIQKASFIAEKRAKHARLLFNTAVELPNTRLDYRHVWVRFPDYSLAPTEKLCPPAVGYSFAAGAEDGPSEIPGYYEGMKQGPHFEPPAPIDFFADLLGRFLGGSREGSECHFPKPIFLSVKNSHSELLPDTLPLQLVLLGNIAIAGVPAEFTTMAGRRLKLTLASELRPLGIDHVILSGLSNEYSGYVTTKEEYNEQNYEGAFTLFGPHTLEAYLSLFKQMAKAMVEQRPITFHAPPEPRTKPLFDFLPQVWFDGKRSSEKFGSVLKQPKTHVKSGSSVTAVFRSANPRNHTINRIKSEISFLKIQIWNGTVWKTLLDDSGPDTLFKWAKDKAWDCIECSQAVVTWKISDRTPSGKYRIVHSGTAKEFGTGKSIPYRGVTLPFWVD